MSMFEKLFGKRSEKRDAISVSDPAIARVFGLSAPIERAALLATASRCIALVSSAYATADLTLYRTAKDGSPTPADNHPLFGILMDGTDDMSSHEVKLRLMQDLLTHGNCFAHVEFDQNGKITNLRPLASRNVITEALGNGRLIYRYSDPLRNFNQTVYSQADIFHARYRPIDYMGRSPLSLASISSSIALEVEEAVAADAARGFRASGILSASGAISDESANRLKTHFETLYSGNQGAGRVAVVGDGLEFKSMGLSGADNEILEHRKLNSYYIAAAFGCPPESVGLPFHSSWNSQSEANRSLVNHALEPWSACLNSQLAAFVLSIRERKAMFLSSNWTPLVSGNLQEKATAYSSLTASGVMTLNEARRAFDLPRIEGGDELRMPLATAAISTDGQQPVAEGAAA